MLPSFYEKVKNLREKILTCKSREEIYQVVKDSELEFKVSYQNSLTILEESFNSEVFQGIFHIHVTCSFSKDEKRIQARCYSPMSLGHNEKISKEEMERKYMETIAHNLRYLNLEEENDA